MKFTIDKNPYDDRQMFEKEEFILSEGCVYCLVGCNGSGKSTVMSYIENELKKERAYQIKGSYMDWRGIFSEEKYSDRLAFYSFDKETHEFMKEEDVFFGRAGVAFSSTGEGIIQRLGTGLELLGGFIRDEKNKGKSLWVLFDDCDAGTSLDMIDDIKRVIEVIKRDCHERGITLTMVLSANSYEMCKDYKCIDAVDFSFVTFSDYEEYKKYVFKTRERKRKQYGDK